MILRPDNLENLGGFLLIHRLMLGITIEDLAKRCGVAKQTIDSIELSRRMPRSSTMAIMADALGLEIEIRQKKRKVDEADDSEGEGAVHPGAAGHDPGGKRMELQQTGVQG